MPADAPFRLAREAVAGWPSGRGDVRIVQLQLERREVRRIVLSGNHYHSIYREQGSDYGDS